MFTRAFRFNNLHSKLLSRSRFFSNEMTKDASNYYFVTTPIYYVNGDPHLGHAYTSVMADIISRYQQAYGKKVYFLTGTDEHGQKVEQSAKKAGKSPIEFADEVSEKFEDLSNKLDCQYTRFIRTTEKSHHESASALWKKLEANGEIYLGSYEGWYSVRDEAFFNENELVDGKAPTGADVQWLKEESYFFRLSAWRDKLLDFYEKNPGFLSPSIRKNEVVAFLNQEGGLKDLSISRTSFNWGIPVPGNDKHIMYVWLDALANYITALGYPDINSELFKSYWPADVHLVGKDILRFHAIYWPAFLMAAGLEPPKKIFAHGWWTKDGEKMSKSLGNVVEPTEIIQKYGSDYLRYFLASEMNFGNDGDFSESSFHKKINELADDFGNLVQRDLVMINKHCNGILPIPNINQLTPKDQELLDLAKIGQHQIYHNLNELNIRMICDIAIAITRAGNRYINEEEPWKLIKKPDGRERMEVVIYVIYNVLRIAGIYFQPIIPKTMENLFEQMNVPIEFRRINSITDELLPQGIKVVSKPSILFPKPQIPK